MDDRWESGFEIPIHHKPTGRNRCLRTLNGCHRTESTQFRVSATLQSRTLIALMVL
jgi:hypothetical protein